MVRTLTADESLCYAEDLGEILYACVESGATVHFLDLHREEATRFFIGVAKQVQAGERILMAALEGNRVVGTVQVALSSPPNQQHRGEISKLLVHPEFRNRGIASALMARAEEEALKAGKWLLILDTATGDNAEKLYQKIGWTKVGTIPNFAFYRDGSMSGATFFYKDLRRTNLESV